MKNELGIEVCCENCYLNFDCNLLVEKNCIINGQYLSFQPSIEASSERIKELQEQQFTKEELTIIIDALQIAKEEFAFCPEEKAFDKILKKIEQTLKNLEGNLNNEQ